MLVNNNNKQYNLPPINLAWEDIGTPLVQVKCKSKLGLENKFIFFDRKNKLILTLTSKL
jgi:hypothetical protein